MAGGRSWTLALPLFAAAAVVVLCWRWVGGGEAPANTALAPLAEPGIAAPGAPGAVPAAEAGRPGSAQATGRAPVEAEPAASGAVPPAPELVLVARFVDPGGAPLVGVRVEVQLHDETGAAQSGADGRVRVRVPWRRSGSVAERQLRVRARGPATTVWSDRRLVAEPGELHVGEIVLESGAVVLGRVVDVAGVPLEGATVVPVELGGENGDQVDALRRAFPLGQVASARHLVPGRSADDGWFRLEGVPAQRLALCARLPGHFPGYSETFTLAPGELHRTLDIVLERAGRADRIDGVVLDADGRPLQAFVELSMAGGAAILRGAGAASDNSGRFTIVVPRDDAFALTVEHPLRPGERIAREPVHAGDADLVLRFGRGRSIDVFVLDPAGRWLPAASVELLDPDGASVRGGGEFLEGGGLRITVPEGAFRIAASAKGYERAVHGPFEPGPLPERLTIQLTRAARLAGRVVDARGAPIAGATVEVHPARREGYTDSDGFVMRLQPRVLALTRSDGDGGFELGITFEGEVALLASADGWARATSAPLLAVPGVDQRGHELVLVRGGAIEGRVLTAAGVDPSGAIVATSCGDGVIQRKSVGPDGVFRFERLTPGPWQVLCVNRGRARRPVDRAPDEPSCLVVDGEATVCDVDLSHEVRGVLHGRLTLGGRPAAGWQAWLHVSGSRAPSSATLDASGAFELATTSSGVAGLTFHGPTGITRSVLQARLEVVAPATAWSLDLPTASLSLANLPPRPADARSVSHQVGWLALSGSPSPGTSWSTTIDPPADGELHLSSVPAGCTLRLRCNRSGIDDPMAWDVLAEVTVAAGAHRRVVLD